MKAIYVLYQRPYGCPECNVKWLIGRPPYWASLVDPRASLIMVIKYLSVGQISRFLYQQIALDVLFQMRYNSFPNSNKQPNDSLKAETPPVFSHLKHCFAYCFAQWCPPGVCRHPSSFWSVTLQPLGADVTTISHMKEEIIYYNMPEGFHD